jgi:adenylate cyclase
VRDQIHDKLPYLIEDLGEQFVKNIARPVRAYALSPETIVGLPSVSRAPLRRSRTRFAAIAAAAAAALAIAGIAWWVWPVPHSTIANPPVAVSTPPLIAPRLSIVVLPFANLSNDPEQQYFADGITDDLTTDLSRLAGVFVIARNTAFTYKDKQIDANQIGRELGVRYMLEGSVRRSGNQVRVNAQLVDAESGAHLWAERFDHEIGDLFALQNEITSRIANTLGWELIGAETARPTDRPDALDYLLRGRAVMGGGGPRENTEKAVDLFEHALALDPRSVEAQSRLANALWFRAGSKDPETAAADFQRAEELIARALAAFPGDPYAHRVKGRLLRFKRRCGEAIPEFEIALAANRNDPYTLGELSMCKYLTGGSDEEAIALTEQAIRLSPRDAGIWWWYTWIGFVHLLQSRTDAAIAWLEKGRTAQPKTPQPHWFLAAAYGFKGELERARTELAEAIKLTGSDRYSSVARSRANGDLYTPALRDRWETTYFPGIRNAGLPEE